MQIPLFLSVVFMFSYKDCVFYQFFYLVVFLVFVKQIRLDRQYRSPQEPCKFFMIHLRGCNECHFLVVSGHFLAPLHLFEIRMTFSQKMLNNWVLFLLPVHVSLYKQVSTNVSPLPKEIELILPIFLWHIDFSIQHFITPSKQGGCYLAGHIVC